MVAPFASQTQLVFLCKLGERCEYVCSNMSSDREEIWERDRYAVCVQEDSGCDVPGQEVEQLAFGSGFDSTFGCSRAFPLVIEGKK